MQYSWKKIEIQWESSVCFEEEGVISWLYVHYKNTYVYERRAERSFVCP